MLMDIFLGMLLVAVGIPVLMFVIECLTGVLRPYQNTPHVDAAGHSSVIIIPAHNEECMIEKTLLSLEAELGAADQILVVADNCNDATADIVRRHGHQVLERQNSMQRGKGYALAYAVGYMKQANTPDIVVVIDADCEIKAGSLQALKGAVVASERPAQACNLMYRGDITRLSVKIAEFAFLVKNRIRLSGLARLGVPVSLTGTGMAFPWQIIASANLANGDLVEDMRLGLELAEAGKGAVYCPDALITSYFPQSQEGEHQQSRRWVHGHLAHILRYAPRLLRNTLQHWDFRQLGILADFLIPPLTLLIGMVTGLTILSVLAGTFSGQWLWAIMALMYLALLGLALVSSWWAYGRSVLTPRELLFLPVFMGAKLRLLISFFFSREKRWVRTTR
jgi:cellulose synthase/poly-beta-1,6-N-acetylglucosamine synthase-like glycosyltransferase